MDSHSRRLCSPFALCFTSSTARSSISARTMPRACSSALFFRSRRLSRPRGKSVRDLHDEAYGTLRVRALRELLPDGNGVGKAVNDNVHPTLAPAERGPGFSDRAEEVNDPSFTPHRLKIKLGVPPRTVGQNLRNLIAFRIFIANSREAHRKYPQGITRRRRKEAHIIGLPHIFNTPQGRLYAQSWTRISISGMHDTVARIPKVCDIGTNPLALVFDY